MSARLALVLVVVLSVLAGGALLFGPLLEDRLAARTVTTEAGDWYEIHFTTPVYPDRPEQRRGGIDERLVSLVDSTNRSLDVAIYDFDLQNVANAMARAHRRGVAVRMVTDADTAGSRNEEIQAALRIVRDAGIPIVDDSRRAIMHHKFVVSDGRVVLTGSWNFTVGDTYRLNNHAVIVRSPEIATNFSNEFEKMFVERRFGPTKSKDVPNPVVRIGDVRVETHFSSQVDPTGRIVELIGEAKERIDFLAFSFTHDDVGQAMIQRGAAGVRVRGVFERTGSETQFSEFGAMKAAGLEVYQDGNPYVMHHKVIVIDGQITIFGSFNFSANAARDNDENLLIVFDRAFARAFLDEVDRVVAVAKNPPARR